MVIIKCINPNCTAPNHKFEWDESKRVEEGGGIAQSYEEGAVRVVAYCPYCAAENPVWVKKLKQEHQVLRNLSAWWK